MKKTAVLLCLLIMFPELAQAKGAPSASRKIASTTDEVPLFRSAHDCNVQLNPILGPLGLSTLTTLKLKGETHIANLVPAPPATPGGRAGFYVLSDRNQATFIDVPVMVDESAHSGFSIHGLTKTLPAITEHTNYYQDDTIDGRLEVEVNLSCTANFDFQDTSGTPVRKLMVGSSGEVMPGGVAIAGTCGATPTSAGVKELPPDKKIDSDKIDRNVAGSRVDAAAIEDLRRRLSAAMEQVSEGIREPAEFGKNHPAVQWAGSVGTTGVEPRKNACHLLSVFFKSYNKCGGLGEIEQKDPEFHQRLVALHKLYEMFREPTDSAECKPPITEPVEESGGQGTRAAP